MLKVSIIQCPLAWENKKENLNYFIQKIKSVSHITDIVVLPEMFATGFSMNPENNFLEMNDQFIVSLQNLANSNNIAIVGSLIIKEKNEYYNRLLFFKPNSELVYYNKRHLFSLAKEDKFYSSGKDRVVVEFKGWKICPLICYDLRFPVFSRNNFDYDLLIYVASWPEKRIYAWDSLLKARSIENMAYTVGVNRIGVDGYNANYNGHSQILDYMGKYIIEPFENEDIKTIELNLEIKNKAIEKLGFLNDQDVYKIID